MHSVSVENYLKTIYFLEAEHRRATTRRIAEQLQVRMASVTGMVKQLASRGYVRCKPYHGAKLTEKGRRVAVSLIRRHRLIELFLVETLGLTWDQVHDEAEVLEHAVSDRLVQRIYEYLGRPDFDPHGSAIPDENGTVTPQGETTLDRVPDGQRAWVAEVADSDAEFLRYLTGLGLKIGTAVHIQGRDPFQGPIAIRVRRKTVSIGSEAARRVRVRLTHPKATTDGDR